MSEKANGGFHGKRAPRSLSSLMIAGPDGRSCLPPRRVSATQPDSRGFAVRAVVAVSLPYVVGRGPTRLLSSPWQGAELQSLTQRQIVATQRPFAKIELDFFGRPWYEFTPPRRLGRSHRVSGPVEVRQRQSKMTRLPDGR